MTNHLPFSVYPPNITSHEIPTQSEVGLSLLPKNGPTDIWRKPGPPVIKTFNAPIFYKPILLSTFQRCRVTVSGNFNGLYDQAGLVFVLKNTTTPTDRKWIKTGIEYVNNAPHISTVAADNWADWSLLPSTTDGIYDDMPVDNLPIKCATFEIERNPTECTLWIYLVQNGGNRLPIREVTWILSEPDTVVWVGMYAAMPTVSVDGKEREGRLEVNFRGWELELLGEEDGLVEE